MSEEYPRRSKTTGRWQKGHSGNPKGRREKARDVLLPHQLATATLNTAARPVEIRDADGRVQRLSAYEVVLRQLAAAAAKGDKASIRLFSNLVTDAGKTIEAHTQRKFDRLGAYLRSVDEGRPWRLDASEAQFYQELAEQAGIEVTIRASDDEPDIVRAEDIDAVLGEPGLQRLLGAAENGLTGDAQRAIVRRTLRAFQQLRSAGAK
jgi:hypothetical protein